MKRTKWILLAGMVLLLMTIGCDKQIGSVAPGDDVKASVLPPMGIRYNPTGSWFLYFNCTPGAYPGEVFAISIGQDNGATGSWVRIWKDADSVYADFHTAGDWYISEAHFDVATTKDGLAHNNSGNLVPGKFKGQKKNNIPYPQFTRVSVKWNASWDGLDLFMAALCKVAEGAQVNGVWTYWNWNTGCGGEGGPFKRVSLPNYQIELMRVNQPFAIPSAPDSNTYWQIALQGIVEDSGTFNVWNGNQWKGWCLEGEIGLGYTWIPVTLVSTEDLSPASDPRLWKNGNWPQVNWLLNHKSLFPKPSLGGPYGWWIYQDVIHYLVGELPPPPTDYWEKTMYDSAMAHPDYLVPTGGWVGVLAITPIDQQLVLLEVDP